MRRHACLLSIVAIALSAPSCTRCRYYPTAYLKALDAAREVLGRHYTVTSVDRAHGVVAAQSGVGANLDTKYRTVAVATVFRIQDGNYDVQIRVNDEIEVSEPSLLGGGQPGYDWRVVAFDHMREAALLAEIQAQLEGKAINAYVPADYAMFRTPTPPPLMRHQDMFRMPVPPPAEAPMEQPAPSQPQSQSPNPTAPAQDQPAERNLQLFARYMSQGDVYLKQGDDKRALLEYQRAAVARPDDAAVYLSQAAAWTGMKQYEQAAGSLRQAAGKSNGERLLGKDIVRLRGLNRDLSDRLMLLKGWCRQNPSDQNARLLLGYHCFLADRSDEARENLQEVLKADPADVAAQYLVRQVDAPRG